MQFRTILRITGLLLMLFSLTMLPPMGISLLFADNHSYPFLFAFLIILLGGFLIWAPVSSHQSELRTRDGFLIVVLFWCTLSLCGSLPLYMMDSKTMSFTDAFFESLSGLTTTGATVITGIDDLPPSILWYRQQLQWLGGMGIIVLAVAILPLLGIGGMQLYRAETPGPIKDNKLTPRITETAKVLWYIYLWLTIVCALAYWVSGMSLFDAISHSFSTIAIGGFSTHDASIGYFNSTAIELIACFFMFLSGTNYALHFYAWRHKSLLTYAKDPEFRFYALLLATVTVVTIVALTATDTYAPAEAAIKGLFEVTSIATTTGFATASFAGWPTFLPFLLFVIAFVGGCAGSTGGGMKVIRALLIIKQGLREVYRLIHPAGVFPVKLGATAVPERVIEAVWGFFSAYVFVFVSLLIALLATGLDQVTAWSAVGACINNLGPGLGEVADNYGDINTAAKWILCAAMLFGRLEIFTLLILFVPAFWKR